MTVDYETYQTIIRTVKKMMENLGNIPNNFKFLSDGSFQLVNEATVWDDMTSQNIVGHNTINYVLEATEFEQPIPYTVFDNNVWLKCSIPANKSITVTFTPDSNKQPVNPDNIFEFFDDFDGNSLDTNKWTGSASINNGTITGNNWDIHSKKSFTLPIIIETKVKYISSTSDTSHWFGIYQGNSFGNNLCYWRFDSSVEIYSPNEKIETINHNDGYDYFVAYYTPNKVGVSANGHYGQSASKKGLNNQSITLKSYSGCKVSVDWVFVRKYADEEPTINVLQNSDGSYTVTISNPNNYNLEDYQVKISGLDLTKTYNVTVKTTTPTLVCDAMPNDKESYLTFYTMFSHQVKVNGIAHFYVRTYIPPDAPEGDVVLKLEWQTHPIEAIIESDTGNIINLSTYNTITKSVKKQFHITSDMHGKNIVLCFCTIDTIKNFDQTVFSNLTRLTDDANDTFNSALPILYASWCAEVDTLGSRTPSEK
ncbi:DUF2341 domain-containing protein [Methanothermococcus okinawensis]|uniref:DUF2341 domain-containing protein n=1 Tax=Methanothermococcus okinawensis (strain DSM 14208 / JCM 11175 / IH1) TaxID=647113 RepID=F8AKB0_METOI|nr:DUF2341 domain-containing protein [Methanothermococcus okinawensis]AEH06310.1 Protein of unknown function DUF2341 [Methanothermococcus okinawensis IH1]